MALLSRIGRGSRKSSATSPGEDGRLIAFLGRSLLRIPPLWLFLGGLFGAIVMAEGVTIVVARLTSDGMTRTLYLAAFFAPLIVASFELVILLAVIAYLRRQNQMRIQAEEGMARALEFRGLIGDILRLSLSDIPLDELLGEALERLLALPWMTHGKQGCICLMDGAGAPRLVASQKADDQAALPNECSGDALSEGVGFYCLSISNAGEVVGKLNVWYGPDVEPDPQERRTLQIYADSLAGIIVRKRMENRLRQSMDLSQALLNAPDDQVFLLGAQGEILAVNYEGADALGVSAIDLEGVAYDKLVSPTIGQLRLQQIAQVVNARKPLFSTEEQKGRIYENRTFPILSDDGVTRVALFRRDITESRQARRQLEQALADLGRSNDDLQQFAYVASHDLRQPLRVISSYLGLIERTMGEGIEGELKEYLDFAIGGAKRMDRLILDLLDYSRIGRDKAAVQRVDLNEAVSDSLLNLRAACQDTGADIAVEGILPSVMGNRSELTRLFQNLIGNAIQYRDPSRPPVIRVGCGSQSGGIVYWVSDNGTGIAEGQYDRAFAVFQRLVSRDHCDGTGIGLAICKKIVTNHGGNIWIESKLGEGSRFLFTLPPVPMDRNRL